MAMCPLISYANQKAECVHGDCALYNAKEEQCGLLSPSTRIEEGFDRLVSAINDIRVRL
ncbi:hypothetical protein D3C78_1820490 [compost metagenome]